MHARTRHLHVALASLLVFALAWMRAPAQDPPRWSSLDAPTQALLAPWSDAWDTLDAPGRMRLAANARRWLAMDAAARSRFQQRAAAWNALPPHLRATRRARYAAWTALPPDEQTRVRTAAIAFAALPAAQQDALRTLHAALDADAQRGWLLGPAMGAWIGPAQALFAFVPADERAPTLRMLAAFAPEERAQLFTLARRLQVPQRERLRHDLLGLAPAQRAAVIARRLGQ